MMSAKCLRAYAHCIVNGGERAALFCAFVKDAPLTVHAVARRWIAIITLRSGTHGSHAWQATPTNGGAITHVKKNRILHRDRATRKHFGSGWASHSAA